MTGLGIFLASPKKETHIDVETNGIPSKMIHELVDFSTSIITFPLATFGVGGDEDTALSDSRGSKQLYEVEI